MDGRFVPVVKEANLVCDWVELYAPVVYQEHTLVDWGEVLILDERTDP